jgi:hypothetical protein
LVFGIVHGNLSEVPGAFGEFPAFGSGRLKLFPILRDEPGDPNPGRNLKLFPVPVIIRLHFILGGEREFSVVLLQLVFESGDENTFLLITHRGVISQPTVPGVNDLAFALNQVFQQGATGGLRVGHAAVLHGKPEVLNRNDFILNPSQHLRLLRVIARFRRFLPTAHELGESDDSQADEYWQLHDVHGLTTTSNRM